MGTILDKIFCTDQFSWMEISGWLGVSQEFIKKTCGQELSVLHAADLGELLDKMTQKDVGSCTERKELEFLTDIVRRLLEQVEADRTKEYALLLYWIADVIAGGIEKYEDALGISEKAVEIVKDIYGEDDHACASYYNLTGNLYYAMEDYDKGIEYCEKAIEILTQASKQQCVDVKDKNEIAGQLAVFFSDTGVMYLRKKKYQKGHEYIAEAEKWLKSIKPENNLTFAKVYCNIGTFFKIIGSSAKALCYMEKAVQIYRKKNMMRELRIAGLCGLMSLEYGSIRRNSRAVYYGEIAREARERMLGEESMKARQMYSSLGVLYMMRHQQKRGRYLLEKSIRNIEKLDPSDYLDAAYICVRTSMGYLEYGRKDKEKGIFCLDQGVSLAEAAEGGRERDKEILYENVASKYFDVGEYTKAIKYQKLLIQKRMAFFQACGESEKKPIGKVVADHIAALGQFYNKMGQSARAIEQYEEAARFCTEVFGQKSDMVGSMCLTLSQLYMNIGDVRSSRERGELAYQIAKEVYGDHSRITVMIERYLDQMIREPEAKQETSLLDRVMEFLFGRKD